MTPETSGVVRHLLTFAGGVLVTMGYLDQGMMNELTGAIITIMGVAWSIQAKSKNKIIK